MKNIISILRAFSGDLGHFVSKWTATSFLSLSLACGLLCGSCGQIKYIPVKGDTVVEYRDSIITKLDSIKVEITNTEYVRDWTGLLDTLELSAEGGKVRSKAWVDTTKSILAGELKTEPRKIDAVVPHTLEYHQKDSVKIQEVPVEVPVEIIKKVYPKWLVIISILGVISTSILGISIYLKVKRK